MYDCGKSDSLIVLKKPANKAIERSVTAEQAEGRGLAKGNARRQNSHRAQNRERLQSELLRIRQIAGDHQRITVTT